MIREKVHAALAEGEAENADEHMEESTAVDREMWCRGRGGCGLCDAAKQR